METTTSRSAPKIDLNKATFKQLQLITGIGPTIALKIKVLQPSISSFDELVLSNTVRLSTAIYIRLRSKFYINLDSLAQSKLLPITTIVSLPPANLQSKSALDNVTALLFKRITRKMRACNRVCGIALGRLRLDVIPNLFNLLLPFLPAPTKVTSSLTTFTFIDATTVFDCLFSSFNGSGYPFAIRKGTNITEINRKKHCVIRYSTTTFKLTMEIPFVKWASEARDNFLWC